MQTRKRSGGQSYRVCRVKLAVALLIFCLAALAARHASAGSATWLLNPSDGNWIPATGNNANWDSGNNKFPGSTSGLTNVDTATFLASNNAAIAINSTSLNVKSLTFGSSMMAPSNYTIGSTGGNALFLTNGGTIAIAGLPSGSTNITENVDTPLVLEPASSSSAGSYTFRNSSGFATDVLNIRGPVSGGTTSQGITLNLTGTNLANISGQISDGGAAAGLAILKNTAATWTFSGANTYGGGTTISNGTLQLSGSGTLGATTGSLTISLGTLELNGTSQTVGALNGSNGGGIALIKSTSGTSTLTVGNGGASGSFAGSITNIGAISVVKVGSGTETFTDNNSYTGSTTISGGTLKLANPSGVALAGGGDVVVNKGGTLLMGANNQINQAVFPAIKLGGATGAVAAKLDAGGFSQGTGGTPAVPNSGSVGLGALTLNSSSVIDLTMTSVFHFSNSSSKTWTGTLSIWDWNGTPITGGGAEQILFGGDATGLNGTQLTQVSFYSDQGTTLLSNTALILADGEIIPGTPIPEPSTWLAAAVALGALGYSQRKHMPGSEARVK